MTTLYRLRPVYQMVAAEQLTREQAEYTIKYDNTPASERGDMKAPELPRGVAFVHGRFMLDVPGTDDDIALAIGDYVLRDVTTGDLHRPAVLHEADFGATYESVEQ